MAWLSKFISSSIGRKLVMSLTGLFLISFLIVHLIGNLQLMYADEGEAFNQYAYFMTTNPLIKTISYGLYAFILIHIVMGVFLWSKNKAARGKSYKVKATRSTGTSAVTASNMMWLGSIIAIFLALHLYQFWLQMKMGNTDPVTYANGQEVRNLYALVAEAFANPIYVWVYVVSMIMVGWHLWHGFQSSFQTLGIEHRKYTPFIQAVGRIYSVVVALGFAIIPLYMYYVILN